MKKVGLFFITVILLLSTSFTVYGSSVPGGPFLPDHANYSLEGFLSNEQLEQRLKQLEHRSNGSMELEIIGTSGQGKNIYMAKVGTGPETVMIQNQQHGNEPHGAEAAINILQYLTTNSKEARDIREQLTVLIIPRVNPDGAGENIRTNGDRFAPNNFSSHGFFTSTSPGWDINRYHSLDWEDSTLYQYNHAGIMTEEFGLITGRSLTGSSFEYEGVEGNLVYVGNGGSSDYTDEIKEKVEGNIALAHRGGSVQTKINNAEENGAVGLVMYNTEPGLPSFSISSEIPVMHTFQEYGLQLVEALNKGEEINADFQNGYPENPVPEAQAVIDTFLEYNPTWMIDVHNQHSYVDGGGNAISGSMLWPTNSDAPEEAVNLSKQMAVVVMDRMEQFGYSNITKFPGGDSPEIARNAYGIAGAGSLLLEIRGQTDTEVGQASRGKLVNEAEEQVMSVIRATADGSLFEQDADRTDELPTERNRYSKDFPHDEVGGEEELEFEVIN